MQAVRNTFFLAVACGALHQHAHATTILTVPVGNPGNPADMRFVSTYGIGFGSVRYHFNIGKYEVTNAQYSDFLNAVDPTGANALALYSGGMSSDARGGILFNGGAAESSKYSTKPGRENNPVAFVSWYDAVRFANWLNNGQGGPGTTEYGAYTLLGGTPTPSNGDSVTRNPGAVWFLPSEDEWYKAAYHKNDGVTGNYWSFPFSSDNVSYSDQPPGTSSPDQAKTANYYKTDNVANGYNDGYAATGSTTFVSAQNYLTDVGAYPLSSSPYGTYDQGGNVIEWNERLSTSQNPPFRGFRGGSWGGEMKSFTELSIRAGSRGSGRPDFDQGNEFGFRVATVPEPSTICILAMTGIAISSRHTRCIFSVNWRKRES